MARYTRIGALTGILAAASLSFTPASAAETAPAAPSAASAFGVTFAGGAFGPAYDQAQADESEYHRRYRRYRRNRIDGGDVLAGVLILGGIAAVASAASRNNERRRYEERTRYEDRRYDDRRYDDRRDTRRSNGTGLDSAVSQCLAEIERDARVESVDGASRVSSGWIVSGTLYNGTGFSCQIDNNGRISNVDYGGMSGVSYDGDDFGEREAEGQWSADSYAQARAAIGPQSPDRPTGTQVSYGEPVEQGRTDEGVEQLPEYPGGPLPGEEEYGE